MKKNNFNVEIESISKELHQLSDEELEQVTAGINWQKFGQYILLHDGGSDPELAELVSAINSGNWPLVAIIAVQEVGAGHQLVVNAFHAKDF